MSEPTCRVCYAKTLTDDERGRFYGEPVTSCIYLCPEHEQAMAEVIAAMPPIEYIKATRSHEPLRFPTTPTETEPETDQPKEGEA
jgi:hypothetical protein